MRSITVLLLVISPAAFGYIRSVTPDALQTPLVRVDNTRIQFYLNNQVVAGAQSSASGGNVTVITADSNPQQALHSALALWNAASSANVHFLPVLPTATGINPGDFQMTIAIGSTAADVSAVGGALAVTGVSSTPQAVNVVNGQLFACSSNCQYPAGGILDTDIILNPAKTFSTTGAANTIDLQAVLTHELGHSLGSNHTGILGAMMFQFNTGQRSLTTDDLAFVNSVYPSTTTPVAFGTISGAVTGISGTALLTMVDTATGANTFGGLTKGDGTFSVQVPAGTYKMYAEPLNGIVRPGNLYFTPLVTAAVLQSTLLGGTVTVTANNSAVANIAAAGGVSAFQTPSVGVTSVNGTASVAFSGGPVFVPSGQSVDLLLAGTGFDSSLNDTNFAVFGPGIVVHAGSVRLDTSGLTFGGHPILRVTLDVAAQATSSLASVFVTKGSSTLSSSGVMVIGPPTPTTTSQSLVNAASYAGNGSGNGAASPGGLYALFDIPGAPNLGPASAVGNAGFDPYGFEAAFLAGVAVTFDGVPAPLVFVAGSQINLQVPFEVAGKQSTKVVVSYLGSVSTAVNVPVLSEQPALISVDSSGKGPVAAVNQDGTLNSAAHPAPRGTVIVIYGTAVGQQPGYPVFPTGQGAALNPNGFTGNYTYSIGGSAPAPANYAGPTPSGVGLAQFNLMVPNTGPGGAASVVVTSPNGVSSQPGTTIFVQSSNVANATGSIDGLYPASGAAAAKNGGMSTTGPVGISALLTAGTFTAAFDILPNANPFTVEAVCPAGSATIQINPAQNTWQATYIVPTPAARNWDFSGDGFVVVNFASGMPYPNNVVPISLVDQLALSAVNLLPAPNVAATGANSTSSASGTLPAGGHFTIPTNAPGNFGGFINLTTRGAQSSKFSLSVDGQLVASTSVPFTTD